MTAIALLQPYLLELFLPRDSSDDLLPACARLEVLTFGIRSSSW